MRVCNVCLTHDPAYGGLHRSVQDFSRALSASVFSFDDGRGERVSVEEGVPVRRLGCGTGWLACDCRVMSAAVARQADAAVADAARPRSNTATWRSSAWMGICPIRPSIP